MVKLSLSNLPRIGDGVAVPAYLGRELTTGIVHFGVGNFHRSHLAMYVDRLLRAGNSNWAICGVGVLSIDSRMRDVLEHQDNLYTLVTKDPSDTADARVIGSIHEYLFAPDDAEAVIEKLANPLTKIVSLTITEGGYSIKNDSGEFDSTRPDIAADLVDQAVPQSVFGFIAEALRRRRQRVLAPFTVMSCDNIQGNGLVAKTAIVGFASLKDPELGAWIRDNVAFPSSMVDRITPVTTADTVLEVSSKWGIDDDWPVISESFEQWVLEDNFPFGRPAFDLVGAQLVVDVEPYEIMKLRLLNASHQAMSYLAILAGFQFVHEACRNHDIAQFVLGYMRDEAAPTLRPVPEIDLDKYQQELLRRFSSTAIADTLARQVVDGSERIPKFILPVLRAQLEAGRSIEHIALVLASWGLYLQGADEQGHALHIQDLRATTLTAAAIEEDERAGALLDVRDVFGDLGQDARLRAGYLAARSALKSEGAITAVRRLNALARG